MNFRIYQQPEPESAPFFKEGRMRSHVENALAIGEGGALAWAKLDAEQNLAALEAQMQILGVDSQKFQQRQQQHVAEDMGDDHHSVEAMADLHAMRQRLELHVWRRCLFLSRRLAGAAAGERADPETMRRFVDVVLRMKRLFVSHEFGEGQIFIRGIRIAAETVEDIMQLCAWRQDDGSDVLPELRRAHGA